MAEGFAKTFGKDCLEVHSAGLNPALIVQEQTRQTMEKRGIHLDGHFAKGIEICANEPFDVVVNMSGALLPRMNAKQVIEWRVADPIGQPERVYEAVADQIDALVTLLIRELRG